MTFNSDPPIRPPEWFAQNLPDLCESECRLTSKCTFDYNCIGFVVGDFRWWHPEDLESHYWPDGVPRDRRKWAHLYAAALETVHFARTDSLPEFDPAFETIAIFHRAGQFSHAALQISPTTWSSKLGDFEDLEHPFSALLNGRYGQVFCYMRRDARSGRKPLPDEYRL